MPTEGDELTDQIQKVGLVSNHVLTAEEFARYKRDHWRILSAAFFYPHLVV